MKQGARTVSGLTLMLAVATNTWAATTVKGSIQIVFTPEERKIVREYYSKDIVVEAWGQEGKGKGKGLPPGLAKKQRLPPGLRKQLQRNGTLPPGLEKKMEPLPQELDVRLKPLPPEHVRVVIGTDVIILDKTTQKILDIMRDVAILTRDITK